MRLEFDIYIWKEEEIQYIFFKFHYKITGEFSDQLNISKCNRVLSV